MPSKVILLQWQARKITAEQASQDLVRSRCSRAPSALQLVHTLTEAERETDQKQGVQQLLHSLEHTLVGFRGHPVVDCWAFEHAQNMARPHFRTACLLLRGASRAGKTQKAMSLFGYSRTLVVNCQGLGTALPSLRGYERGLHDAIVFDEIDEKQVLANKLVFQCGPWPVELSQSVCNQHSYKRWFYNCAMILCSNTFRMTVAEGVADKQAEDWLDANIMDARLLPGQKWYRSPEKARPAPDTSCSQ